MAYKNGMKTPFGVIAITIFILINLRFANSVTLRSEINVLKALKQMIDPNSIPELSFLSTWNFAVDPCESAGNHFLGVLCLIPDDNSTYSRIITLDLDGVGYDGFLTEEIGNLSQLTSLNLARNKFRGPIPDNFGRLSKLTTLVLSENFFTGSMPPGLRRLKRLQELDVSLNKLTGPVPEWISNFRAMSSLKMSYNGFSGRVPNLSGLWQLSTLELNNNELFGTLPQLPSSLRVLTLSHNVLSGTINTLFRLRSLKTLDLSDNRFTGAIRGVVSLPELISLNLSSNWFTQMEVPKLTGGVTQLEVLDVQVNRIQGHLPVNLVTVQNLTAINLSHNQFSGPIPREYGLRLGAPWRRLYLDHNFLVGGVPPQFGDRRLRIKGSLAYNCLKCPRNVSICNGSQRPASECIGQVTT